VWANPQSAFVAEFLGLGNILDGEVGAEMMNVEGRRMNVKTVYGLFSVERERKNSEGDKVKLLVRPLSVNDEANVISGVVADVIFQHDRYKVTFDNGLYVYLNEKPKIGEKISVQVKVECLA
jgi:ABC-type Fe3+/spermidine/putrescine transport system ATPase subunit